MYITSIKRILFFEKRKNDIQQNDVDYESISFCSALRKRLILTFALLVDFRLYALLAIPIDYPSRSITQYLYILFFFKIFFCERERKKDDEDYDYYFSRIPCFPRQSFIGFSFLEILLELCLIFIIKY